MPLSPFTNNTTALQRLPMHTTQILILLQALLPSRSARLRIVVARGIGRVVFLCIAFGRRGATTAGTQAWKC